MKTFKSLPEAMYYVSARNPEKFREWLHSYGCNLVLEPAFDDIGGSDFYIMTNHYGYFIERWAKPHEGVLTPKQFKKLVREAVGEPE